MSKVCFYFQLHQPYRLRDVSIFDIGEHTDYFTDEADINKSIFRKVSQKSYLPMLKLLQRLLHEVPEFVCSLSCSGVFLEQAEDYQPEVIELLQQLVKTGKVELLAETYYHSLASLYSPSEFKLQVQQHTEYLKKLFDYVPSVFRNTELIYSHDIAKQVAELGFQGMLTEAVDRYLHGRPKTRVYRSSGPEALPLLLKHAEFSDDLAFRFSDTQWPEYPLTVEKYLQWLSGYYREDIINLFMDFETFGEHQWEDTGIFSFFEAFIKTFALSEYNTFITPSQAIVQTTQKSLVTHDIVGHAGHRPLVERITETVKSLFRRGSEDGSRELGGRTYLNSLPSANSQLPVYDVPKPISWADVNRDLTAWIENPLQQDTLKQLYNLESTIQKQSVNRSQLPIIDVWRRLQTSDHFYYMCTKWAADGDVHAYFSPYESPYEAYRSYSIVLADITDQVHKIRK